MHDSREREIKISLISFLNEFEPSIIATEVPLLDSQRRADILMIRNDHSYAFEIKSETDKIERLKDQIKIYTGCFDYISVVVDHSHLPIKNLGIPTSIGVYAFQNNTIILVRPPVKRKDKSKSKILSSLTYKELKKIKSTTEITKEKANFTLIRHWIEKYHYGYSLFKKEIGETIIYDDLHHLRPNRKDIIS